MKVYQGLKNFLFLDIETVREYATYEEFTKVRSADNWERVAKKHMGDENLTPAQAYEKKAALYVEYGKIVTICVGNFDSDFNHKIGALSDSNEKVLLEKFRDYLTKYNDKFPDTIICGHNIKEFDIPYIIKRMILHNIKIPTMLKNYLAAKAWDQKATDTIYDWRIGGNRFMSLDSIGEFLTIQSSKTGEISGEHLGEYYYDESIPYVEKIEKINTYCKGDVRVVMELAKRFYDVL
jgi:DNA polymerase elongation subunit (family B)